MNDITIILSLIITLFLLFLLVKQMTSLRFCVLCASVSTSWLLLLVLYWFSVSVDPVLIAVLMGQSVVGIYYLLEKKVQEEIYIFRLPFLLTCTVVVFALLGFSADLFVPLILLGILWSVLIVVYTYRSNPKVKRIVKKLVECCKNW